MTRSVTLPIIAGFGVVTKFASDLNESMNAVNVVFRESATAIFKFGETASNTVGLSQAQFQQMSTVLGSALRNAGFSQDEMAEKTISLTKRASDMASVFNTDVSDALAAIQAALRGEVDPIERYGVGLNAAAVEAEAAALGFKKVEGELTQQGKAAARLSLIIKQTDQVQGDFVNTSDQFANSLRTLKADLADSAAKIGTAFLPALTKAISSLTPMIEQIATAFTSLSQGQQEMIGKALIAAAALGPLIAAFGYVTSGVVSLFKSFAFARGAFTVLSGGAFGLAGSLTAVRAALAAATGPIGLVVGAVVALASAISTNAGGIRDTLIKIGSEIAQFWADAVASINEILREFNLDVSEVLDLMRQQWDNFWANFSAILLAAWTTIRNVLSQVIDGFVTFVKTVKAIISGEWRRAGELIASFWERSWNRLQAIVTRAFASVIGVVLRGVEGINKAIKAVGGEGFDTSGFKAFVDSLNEQADAFDQAGRRIADTSQQLRVIVSEGIDYSQMIPRKDAKTTGKSGGGDGNEEAKRIKSATEQIKEAIAGLKREFRLFGDDSFEAAAKYDLLNSALAKTPKHFQEQFLKWSKLMDVRRKSKEIEDSLAEIETKRNEAISRHNEVIAAAQAAAVARMRSLIDEREVINAVTSDERARVAIIQQFRREIVTGVIPAQALLNATLAEQNRLTEKSINGMRAFGEALKDAFKKAREAAADKSAAALKKFGEALKKYADEASRAAEESTKRFNDAMLDLRVRFAEATSRTEAFRLAMEKLKESFGGGEAGAKRAKEYMDELFRVEKAEAFKEQMKDLAKSIEDAFMRTFDNVMDKGFDGFFKNVYKGFQTMLADIAREWLEFQVRMLVQRNVNWGLGQLFGGLAAGGGGGGGGTQINTGFTLGMRAFGGPMLPDTPYLVHKDEVVVSRGMGADVIPANKTGGLGDTYVTINVTTPDADSFRKSRMQIAREVSRALGGR